MSDQRRRLVKWAPLAYPGWMRGLQGGVVGVLMVACWAGVAEAKPNRQGFTGDLSLGAALVLVPQTTVTSCSGCPGGFRAEESRETKFGLAGLSVSLGGYVTPQVALVARLAGTSFFDDGDQYGNNFYGVGAEVWPIDQLFLGAGVGFALFGKNPLYSSGDADQEGGWALDFRIGTALAQGKNHDFILSLEAIPGFYEGGSVLGFGLMGGWKWY